MMYEWGIPFDHIEANWTDRQFALMSRMCVERHERSAPREKEGGAKMKLGDWMGTVGIN